MQPLPPRLTMLMRSPVSLAYAYLSIDRRQIERGEFTELPLVACRCRRRFLEELVRLCQGRSEADGNPETQLVMKP